MISTFQVSPRICKYHNLPEEFICMYKDCQYHAFVCSDCSRESHSTHIHDIRSIQAFADSFIQKIKFFQTQFQKDKVVVNVKEIIRSKISELDKAMNQIVCELVKVLEKEKEDVRNRLLKLQEKYDAMEVEFRKNLEARHDCLDYLSCYKNSPKALEARIICSSEWGIVSLKNALVELKNLSLHQTRDADVITKEIMQEGENILKEESLIFSLKKFINHNSLKKSLSEIRNSRLNQFIEKSLAGRKASPPVIAGPVTSRVIEEPRPRTFSLSNLYKPISSQHIVIKTPSIERISLSKLPSMEKFQVNKEVSMEKIQTNRMPSIQKIQSKTPPSIERIQTRTPPSIERIQSKTPPSIERIQRTPSLIEKIQSRTPFLIEKIQVSKGPSIERIQASKLPSMEKIQVNKGYSMQKIQMSNMPSMEKIQVSKGPSMEKIQVFRVPSNERIPTTRQPMIERGPIKSEADSSLDNQSYLRGLRRLKIEKVIIR